MNPVTYWTERGRTFEAEAVSQGWTEAEEPALTALLSTLVFDSMLEVGCGFGRVGASVLARRPWVRYTGVDVSPDMLTSAQRRMPGAEFICADLATWDDEREWDLVLAVSALSHVRPEHIEGLLWRLWRMTGHDLVILDWNDVGAETPYQWGHDFGAMIGSDLHCSENIGRLSLWHAR